MHRDHGFSLIELLVVVAILGILASVGIIQFSTYKGRTYDMGARADLRVAAEAEEAYFIDNSLYLSCADGACLESAGGLPGLQGLSPTVSMNIAADNNGVPSFTGQAEASLGTGIIIQYDSSAGGFIN